MPLFRYRVTEYDPTRPWVVVRQRSGLTVELEEPTCFSEWAADEWPAPRFRAEIENDELPPWRY